MAINDDKDSNGNLDQELNSPEYYAGLIIFCIILAITINFFLFIILPILYRYGRSICTCHSNIDSDSEYQYGIMSLIDLLSNHNLSFNEVQNDIESQQDIHTRTIFI